MLGYQWQMFTLLSRARSLETEKKTVEGEGLSIDGDPEEGAVLTVREAACVKPGVTINSLTYPDPQETHREVVRDEARINKGEYGF